MMRHADAADRIRTASPEMFGIDEVTLTFGRPEGQPGTVNRNHRHPGWTYPAIQTLDGTVLFWRDTTDSAGRWIVAPPALAASFEPGPEWQAMCPHVDEHPWRTCDTEADCDARIREGR